MVAAVKVTGRAIVLVAGFGIGAGIEDVRADRAAYGLVIRVHLVQVGVFDRAGGLGFLTVLVGFVGSAENLFELSR